MPRYRGHVSSRDGIGEHSEGRIGLVPVVVPVPDLRANAARGEERAEMTADYRRTLRRRKPHARIVLGLVVRLVLKRDRENGQTLPLIRLDPPAEILGERAVESREQRPLDETSGRLHPARRAPRAANEFELRVDREGTLE